MSASGIQSTLQGLEIHLNVPDMRLCIVRKNLFTFHDELSHRALIARIEFARFLETLLNVRMLPRPREKDADRLAQKHELIPDRDEGDDRISRSNFVDRYSGECANHAVNNRLIEDAIQIPAPLFSRECAAELLRVAGRRFCYREERLSAVTLLPTSLVGDAPCRTKDRPNGPNGLHPRRPLGRVQGHSVLDNCDGHGRQYEADVSDKKRVQSITSGFWGGILT